MCISALSIEYDVKAVTHSMFAELCKNPYTDFCMTSADLYLAPV